MKPYESLKSVLIGFPANKTISTLSPTHCFVTRVDPRVDYSNKTTLYVLQFTLLFSKHFLESGVKTLSILKCKTSCKLLCTHSNNMQTIYNFVKLNVSDFYHNANYWARPDSFPLY